MPTLMLRGLDAALVARVRAYARAHDLALTDAVDHLLTRGLDALEAVSSGGHARWQGTAADERTASARRAAQARWKR